MDTPSPLRAWSALTLLVPSLPSAAAVLGAAATLAALGALAACGRRGGPGGAEHGSVRQPAGLR